MIVLVLQYRQDGTGHGVSLVPVVGQLVDDMNAAVGLFDLLTFDFGVDDLMIGLFDLDLDILVSIGSGLFLGRI